MLRHLYTSSAGIKHFIDDDEHGRFRIVSLGDAEAILERNKAMATHNDGYSPSRELRRVASIPLIVMLKWLNEEGWWALDPANEGKLKTKLNSIEYLHLRTAPGRV
jgi:hypothetical protein